MATTDSDNDAKRKWMTVNPAGGGGVKWEILPPTRAKTTNFLTVYTILY